MTQIRTTPLPAITAPILVEAPELTEGETAFTLVSLVGTPLQDYPWGGPVHVDPYLAPLPPTGGATGPLLLGGSLFPGAQLRLLWRGPSTAGEHSVRVTCFPTFQLD